jgi:hypothetical protein
MNNARDSPGGQQSSNVNVLQYTPNLSGNAIFTDRLIYCDCCGMNLHLEDFPTHYFICRRLLEISGQYTMFATFQDLGDYESDAMNHKVIRRLKNIEDAASIVLNNKEDDNDMCCICMETLPKSVRKTKCDHEFCVGCFDTWFEKNTTCPICKRDYSEEACYDLVDTQNMEIVSTGDSQGADNSTLLGENNAPIVRSIIRRLDIIGSILDSVDE